MSEIHSIIFLLAVAALLAQLALLVNVPYPVFLVLGGLAMGFVPVLPAVQFPPEMILLIFMPPILTSSSLSLSPLDLRTHLRAVVFLAVGLVILTTLAVAVLVHYFVGLPWAAAFVLGAILAPTDPVAADAVFGRLGVPESVSTIVGGESLVNDGTGLAAYRIAVAAVVTGTFSVWEAGLDFLLVGGGGLILGIALAWVILPLWGRINDPSVAISFSLLIPYAVYILGQEVLHVSGILAVVAYGLYQGRRMPRLFSEASTRLRAASFWSTLVFLLEALLFVLVGQQLPIVLGNLEGYSIVEIVLYAALVYGALVGIRFAWFFAVPYLSRALDRIFRNESLGASWRERLVMSWSGMRGAVSLAAALAIPLQTNAGDGFPGRDLIVFLTYAGILATLVVQGFTIGPLISALGLGRDVEKETTAQLETRIAGARAALDRLEQTSEDEEVSQEAQDHMREHYEDSIRRYSAGLKSSDTTKGYREGSAAWKSWRRGLIAAEREAISSRRKEGKISANAASPILRELSLEESCISG